MYGINKATLVGIVGDIPKTYDKNGEVFFITFPLATSETNRDADNKEVTTTQWHRIKATGQNAKVMAQYVNKADKLYIEGKIVNEPWTGTGDLLRTYYNTAIQVDNFLFLKPKKA